MIVWGKKCSSHSFSVVYFFWNAINRKRRANIQPYTVHQDSNEHLSSSASKCELVIGTRSSSQHARSNPRNKTFNSLFICENVASLRGAVKVPLWNTSSWISVERVPGNWAFVIPIASAGSYSRSERGLERRAHWSVIIQVEVDIP